MRFQVFLNSHLQIDQPLGSFNKCYFLATSQISVLISAKCVVPHTPTDGMDLIFSLTPMLQPGIELTSVQLHLFERP